MPFVPFVPSVIMPVMVAGGQGAVVLAQLLGPLWSCMSPGFTMPPVGETVLGTRTQPLDSCKMVARMNRGSTPVVLATDWTELSMSEISAGLLFSLLNCVQEVERMFWLLARMVA